jgi:hypothetical protein
LEATKREELEMDEDAGTESMTVAVPGRGLTKVYVSNNDPQLPEWNNNIPIKETHSFCRPFTFSQYH